jgi:hypothetical protein
MSRFMGTGQCPVRLDFQPLRSGERPALLGRLREIANGCFVEAKHEGAVAARQTALEKPDGQKWAGTRRSPLRVCRRKAAVEVLGPGSSHSSASAGDPVLSFNRSRVQRPFPRAK